jgi:hypothetical protein
MQSAPVTLAQVNSAASLIDEAMVADCDDRLDEQLQMQETAR